MGRVRVSWEWRRSCLHTTQHWKSLPRDSRHTPVSVASHQNCSMWGWPKSNRVLELTTWRLALLDRTTRLLDSLDRTFLRSCTQNLLSVPVRFCRNSLWKAASNALRWARPLAFCAPEVATGRYLRNSVAWFTTSAPDHQQIAARVSLCSVRKVVQ